MKKLFTNPITGDFDLIRAILVIYAVIFLAHYLLSGIAITTSWLSYTVPSPGPEELAGLLTTAGLYFGKRTMDQRTRTKKESKKEPPNAV